MVGPAQLFDAVCTIAGKTVGLLASKNLHLRCLGGRAFEIECAVIFNQKYFVRFESWFLSLRLLYRFYIELLLSLSFLCASSLG